MYGWGSTVNRMNNITQKKDPDSVYGFQIAGAQSQLIKNVHALTPLHLSSKQRII